MRDDLLAGRISPDVKKTTERGRIRILIKNVAERPRSAVVPVICSHLNNPVFYFAILYFSYGSIRGRPSRTANINHGPRGIRYIAKEHRFSGPPYNDNKSAASKTR